MQVLEWEIEEKRNEHNTYFRHEYGRKYCSYKCLCIDGFYEHYKKGKQEEDWKQLGVPLNCATSANWIIYCTENYLRHVYDYFHRQLLMRKYLAADAVLFQSVWLRTVLKSKKTYRRAEKTVTSWKRKADTGCILGLAGPTTPKQGKPFGESGGLCPKSERHPDDYLEDGHCSLSNNLSGDAIRPFTVGRKNWLFSASPKGATASAIV